MRPVECKNCKCWDCGNIFCKQWLLCKPETCEKKEMCDKYIESASEG